VFTRNAQDLINEYLQKKAKLDKATYAKKSASSASLRKNKSEDGKSVSQMSTKRRKSEIKEDSDVEMSEPEVPKKKAKTKAASASNGVTNKRAKITTKVEDDDDEDDESVGNMAKHMHLKQWDHMVQSIDTVERRDDGALMVYFTL
jgi:hypothetical protein